MREANMDSFESIISSGTAGKPQATFVIKARSKQDATWNGQLFWAEKNETKPFRSVLELIKLIDSAAEESSI